PQQEHAADMRWGSREAFERRKDGITGGGTIIRKPHAPDHLLEIDETQELLERYTPQELVDLSLPDARRDDPAAQVGTLAVESPEPAREDWLDGGWDRLCGHERVEEGDGHERYETGAEKRAPRDPIRLPNRFPHHSGGLRLGSCERRALANLR